MIKKSTFDKYLCFWALTASCMSALSLETIKDKKSPYTVYDFFYNLATGKKTYVTQDFKERVWTDKKNWYLVDSNEQVCGITRNDTLQFNKFFSYLNSAKNGELNTVQKITNSTIEVIEELVDYDEELQKIVKVRFPEGLKSSLATNDQLKFQENLEKLKNINSSYCEIPLVMGLRECIKYKKILPKAEYKSKAHDLMFGAHFFSGRATIYQLFKYLIINMQDKEVKFYKPHDTEFYAMQCYFRDRSVVDPCGKLLYCKNESSYIAIAQVDQGIIQGDTEIDSLDGKQIDNKQPKQKASIFKPCYVVKPGTRLTTYHWLNINIERLFVGAVLLIGGMEWHRRRNPEFNRALWQQMIP